ncbi:IS66 family insertion sequence hypothetical protein, partial [Photorhabdus noenieputensis]|nr:IS66 family insertion sequence hypothetical protein [Photorhabdus noenieputensis]MBS9440053.1 IS66 family insertion sequence hypothetical protein [Photorhabdus noenieputensis]MBS9440076.1 IS66 family insertion sequence hypothetical protein [Photorhabdus noenieputensis]MBS9440078.1 IS66 family insertion sequence hypothetical protein [Photorhabdus noenieputensis]
MFFLSGPCTLLLPYLHLETDTMSRSRYTPEQKQQH